MIKKCLVFTFIIFVFFMVFQYGINYLKTEHSVNYVLVFDKEEYSVKEVYDKSNVFDYYYFDVVHNDIHFLFEEDNVFNKQKNVVKNINTYYLNDLECMSLVYINDEESDLLCSKDNKLYSYVGLKSSYDFSSIAGDRGLENKDKVATSDDLIVNMDYTYDDETLLVYNYKNIMKYSGDFLIEKIVFSSSDTYKNNFGILIDNYYVLPRLTQSPEFSYYYVFNIFDGSMFEIFVPIPMSKNIINLGIYDDKIYVFDKEKQNEFTIDIYSREIEHIASKDGEGVIYKDGKLQNISISELSSTGEVFDYIDKAYEKLEYDKIFTLEKYAIYIKDNSFYKVYPSALDRPIYLFSETDFKEVRIKEDRIYYLKGDTLYRYDDKGIYPLIKRGEFKFNPTNAYDVYLSK